MTTYELIFDCYITGQMTERDLVERLSRDAVFNAWFEKRMKRRLIDQRIRQATC